MTRIMGRFVLVATVLGLIVGAAGKSKADLVTNGGFESGNGVIGGTSNFQGWTLSGDWYPWTYIVGSTFGLPGGVNYEAQLGTNYTLGFLSQTLTTVPGQSYKLDYWMRTGGGGEEFQTYWNGSKIADLTGVPKEPWTEYTFDVTASGASTELKFGFENNENWFHFDNVSVSQPNAVPEPSTLVCVGIGGLICLGYGWHRRNRTAA